MRTRDEQPERKVCAAICQSNGVKAKEIAALLKLDRNTVNHILYASPLLKELCYQDRDYRWHGIIRQTRPHSGLFEFSGYYGLVSEFLGLTEEAWLESLIDGCQRIGRSVNDTRGLFHSFRDCREQMFRLFADLRDMLGDACLDWEIVFGQEYEVIPALVLTAAKEMFDFVPIGGSDAILPVCSGDMLFNVFDEYLGFLSEGE